MPSWHKYLRLAVLGVGIFAASSLVSAQQQRFGYGSPASPEQIAAWDIDVRPDGQGLPAGEGSVEDGEDLFEAKCAQCHGSFGESVGAYPALAGGDGSLTDPRPQKTVGSYWRYTSTLWDYIHRAMPFTQPESLGDDEVYAITAYVLHLNDLVNYDFVLTRDNLSSVRLPNEDNFISDPRPDTKNIRCMQRCKDPATVKVASEAVAYVPASDAATLHREKRAAKSAPLTSQTGSGIYERHCALCHAEGIGGAPLVADVPAWSRRIAQGADVLYRHAIEGYAGEDGIMPPKGGFMSLSDSEVRLAVDYIVKRSQ